MPQKPQPMSAGAAASEEWAVTTSGGIITKIEAIDRVTQQRTDVSAQSGLVAGHGGGGQAEEAVVTTSNLLIIKIEKVDSATRRRTELSREEYAGLFAMMGAAAYYAGIRDYALAVATGDTNAAQVHYQAMTDYFAGAGLS
jgi:hypothetical protein